MVDFRKIKNAIIDFMDSLLGVHPCHTRKYREQLEFWDKLMVIARGDFDLVVNSIKKAALGKKSADLGEVVNLIKENRKPMDTDKKCRCKVNDYHADVKEFHTAFRSSNSYIS